MTSTPSGAIATGSPAGRLVVSAGTPLMLSGAGDEPFPEVLGSGPAWYLPAIITQTSLGAVAYLASVVLLIRGSAEEGP